MNLYTVSFPRGIIELYTYIFYLFCLFILFMGFSRQAYWSGLPFPSPVDHILSQNSLPWPIHLGWPHTAWFSFIELDKVVVHMIRLSSFLWLWLVCLPSDASCNTYHLTWLSLSLDVGYLFTAAPAKHSRCSLPWVRGISSQPPPRPWTWSSSSRPSWAHAAAASWTSSCSSGLWPLTLGVG